MQTEVKIGKAVERLQEIEAYLNSIFFEREDIIRSLLVALLAKEHAVILGPPGTAKSELTRSLTQCFVDQTSSLGLSYFEYLATAFLLPEHLFGPPDLAGYKSGDARCITKGKVAESEVVFLDECFKASGASLNMLLGVMNERIFQNGNTRINVPLMTFIGASNELPQGDETAALWDRFLLRLEVNYLFSKWENMMLADQAPHPVTMDKITLVTLQNTVPLIGVDNNIIKLLLQLKQYLASEGINVSDRRWKKSIRLLRAHALLQGRSSVTEDDLDILRYVLWNDPKDTRIVAKQIGRVGNPYNVQYLDIVDSALIVYQQAKEQNSKINDDVERAKYLIEAFAKMKGANKKLKDISSHAKGHRVDAAKARFRAAYEEIAELVM